MSVRRKSVFDRSKNVGNLGGAPESDERNNKTSLGTKLEAEKGM